MIWTIISALWIWKLCEKWDAHDDRKAALREQERKQKLREQERAQQAAERRRIAAIPAPAPTLFWDAGEWKVLTR